MGNLSGLGLPWMSHSKSMDSRQRQVHGNECLLPGAVLREELSFGSDLV